MRFLSPHVRSALIASCILAVCACSNHHPVAQNAVAQPPAIKQKSLPTPAASAQAAQNSSTESKKDEPVQPAAAVQPAPPLTPPAADAVGELIDQAEQHYQAGLFNYHAGNTEQAKQDFDQALNSLLDSKLDVRSDDRLEKEFDRIVQGVNQVYPGGTSGDSETAQEQQKSEPAPIDETSGIAPTADASTKAKAEAELLKTKSDLPLMMTDQVAGYITYFSTHGRGVFERALARSGRYREMMLPILKQEGVPQDLIYLAQAESGFHALAVSRVGARGIWQFMGSRARGYGLIHNMWVDDRQDPEKSTRAAARHLKELYNQFGDWYLAMAAYNSGPGTVQAAVKRTGYADFWELYQRNVLPKETRNYVPIILAVTIMAKNPAQYGFENVVMEHPPDYDTVTIDYPVDLRLVAQCIDSSSAELQDLNPSLLRLSTPREGKYQLHLPAGTRDQYLAAISDIPPDMRLWWRYHTVRPGDTVASLAHVYHVTARSILETNHLDSTQLDADAKLVIPIAPGKHPSDTATYARRITRYKVRKGDTIQTVAENFGVSPQMLRRWNGLHGDSLRGRKVLALHLPISPPMGEAEVAHSSKSKPSKTETASVKPPSKSAQIARLKDESDEDAASSRKTVLHHRVKSGETFYSIASLYNTTVAALKRENRNIAVLRPGMILTIQPMR